MGQNLLIIISVLLSTILGFFINIISSWLYPPLEKRKRLIISLFIGLLVLYIITSVFQAQRSSISSEGNQKTNISLYGTPNQSETPNGSAEITGRVTFTVFKNDKSQIYSANPDGTDIKVLTNLDGEDDSYLSSWSPDLSKIAFTSNRGDEAKIYIMNADGSDQHPITSGTYTNAYPSWSPDGHHIAFVSFRDGNAEIYVMDVDGSNQRRLTNNNTLDSHPSWSPDSKSIVYSSIAPGISKIVIIGIDGSMERVILQESSALLDPDWSPDGQYIAFVAGKINGGINDGIYSINSDGTNQKLIVGGSYSHPTWSPDGQYIAFVSDQDGSGSIFIKKLNGSLQYKLNTSIQESMFPAWSRR